MSSSLDDVVVDADSAATAATTAVASSPAETLNCP